MILPIIVLTVTIALVFTVMALARGGILPTILSVITWLAAAGSSLVTEVPYQFIDNTNTVVTGTQKFTGGESVMSFLFLGFAIIMIIFLYMVVTEMGTQQMKGLR